MIDDDEWARAESRARENSGAIEWNGLLSLHTNQQGFNMAQRNEIADVLAYSTVQKAIRQMIEEAAALSGVNKAAGQRMAIGVVDRIVKGEPVDSAIALVRAIQEASTPDSVSPKQKSS